MTTNFLPNFTTENGNKIILNQGSKGWGIFMISKCGAKFQNPQMLETDPESFSPAIYFSIRLAGKDWKDFQSC
jgi:hypothetical protein